MQLNWTKNTIVIAERTLSISFEDCKQDSFCDSETGRF